MKHAAALRLCLDGLARLLLGADEEDPVAAAHHVAHKIERGFQAAHGLLQIDDVDAVPLCKNKRTHLRVPAASLVPEVDARFQ